MGWNACKECNSSVDLELIKRQIILGGYNQIKWPIKDTKSSSRCSLAALKSRCCIDSSAYSPASKTPETSVIQPQGNEFCQQPVSLEKILRSKWEYSSVNTLKSPCETLSKKPSYVLPGLHTCRNHEIINEQWFGPLSVWQLLHGNKN